MRKRINIDKNWKFYLGNLAPKTDTEGWGGAKARAFSFGVPSRKFNDSKWRSVDIPHDFVSEGEYSCKSVDKDMTAIPEMESMDSRHAAAGSLETGVAWYRRHFTLDKSDEGKRVYLFFDGVYRNSTAYLNEYLVGTHNSGYTSFYYDITDFVNFDEENILAVRVDAAGREGWWYEGGGIYRHVYIEVRDAVSIAPDGVFAAPEVNLETGRASVKISTEIDSKLLCDKDISVRSTIRGEEGEIISESCIEANIPKWDTINVQDSAVIENARLWGLDEPYLYTLVTEICRDGEVCDSTETHFGVRDIRFDADKGFFLNGEQVKIKGVCAHHDHAGCGIGVPDSVQEYRIAQLKGMGANGYRCAHYPPTRELLDICDRLGMLVMDETRRMSSSNEDLDCLRSMVKRDRNHPSIFIWGIGNEEIFSQDKPETARTTVTMRMEVRKLDDTRPITSAVVCWNGEQRFDTAESYVDVTKHLDVMGFNYCTSAWDDYHRRMPEQPIIVTESSSNSGTRGCYSTNEALGHYYVLDKDNINKVETKRKAEKKDMGESEWKYTAEREYLAGAFIWTGIDYRGEATPLKYPAVYSQFGALDYCGFPKDNYYYYRSWWSGEDTLHIFPHWTLPGMEGKAVPIYCYSNLDEVELFVNGKSCGRKSMDRNWYLGWDNAVYEPGELKAVGYRNGKAVMEKTVKTAGAPHSINAEVYNKAVKPYDAVIVNIRIEDENGDLSPNADNRLFFDIKKGRLIGTGNGNPGDHDSEKLPMRRAFNGMCQLIVEADENGEISVDIMSPGLQGQSIG